MYRFMGHNQDIYDPAFLKSYGGLIGQVAHAAVSKLLKRFEGGLWDKFAFTRYLKPFGIKFNSLMAANAQHKKHVMKVMDVLPHLFGIPNGGGTVQGRGTTTTTTQDL